MFSVPDCNTRHSEVDIHLFFVVSDLKVLIFSKRGTLLDEGEGQGLKLLLTGHTVMGKWNRGLERKVTGRKPCGR
jgi:hypothetical protein